MKKIKSLLSVVCALVLATSMLGCPQQPTGPVSKDFTPEDALDITKPSEGWGVYKVFSLDEFAGKDVNIELSCEMKVINTGTQDGEFKWQVNVDGYPIVASRVIKPEENDWIKVEGKLEKPVSIVAGKVLYLSNDGVDTVNSTVSIRNIKYTVSYDGGGEPEKKPSKEYPTDIFTVGEAGTCGLKIGDKALIPFSEAIKFDAVASDIVYNADGSVTWTASAAGGAGGGVAFYFDADQSVLNTANYDSVDLEFTYSPITGSWNPDASIPGFCLRLLTFDSTGIFGGAVDAEYFDATEDYGTLTKNVDFDKNGISAKVVDASEFDGIKAFVLKFNDYQRGNTNGDKLRVQLKKVTFNRKANAPADAPYDDGLTDDQRGTVTSVYYQTKDWSEIKAKDDAIAAANAAIAAANKLEDEAEKAAALEKAKADLEKANATVLSEAATKGYEKHAWVYTPAGYDAKDTETKYPVFVLLHGYGQNENTWGLSDQGTGGKIKGYMDRGMADGSVKPFILICVTGVASKNWGPNGSGDDINGFNAFTGELREDILPWMYENYNCIEDRNHTAIAGLSMGGGQTFNNGFLDSLDLISYFGAFSAAVFSSADDFKASVAKKWADNPEYKAHYLYMICGDNDAQVYAGSDWSPSWQSYVDTLNDKAWPERVEKFSSTVVPGGTHDFPVWFKGFGEYITYVFK